MIRRALNWAVGPIHRRRHRRIDNTVYAALLGRVTCPYARPIADQLDIPVNDVVDSLGRLRADGRAVYHSTPSVRGWTAVEPAGHVR